MTRKVFITTPIYYANAVPHIGNAYTSFICDVLARTKRLAGYEVKFSTGTDENGQKMTKTAEKLGVDVMDFLDDIAQKHQDVWDRLSISYTDFIRTSGPEHHAFVQEVLQKTYDKGDVYEGVYEGLYCVGCEGFKKEDDLVERDGKLVCPDHLVVPDRLKEKNRFFQLSAFQHELLGRYQKHKTFCLPQHRFNEVISFVEQGLDDFSISREGSDFGIRLPFDQSSVTYIRFDALYNYVTVCAKRSTISGKNDDMEFWNDAEVIHVIGKDISRFHAVYRPAMLLSVGYKLPDTVLINGFFTIDGQKMSKSLGNVIDPVACVEEHGRDALVYYFFSDIKIGNDGDFSRERFLSTKESVLKKGRGNLVSRVCTLAQKYNIYSITLSDSDIQEFLDLGKEEGLQKNRLFGAFHDGMLQQAVDEYMKEYDIMSYLREWFQLVQLGNKYIDATEPRKVGKEHPERAQQILSVLIRYIKGVSLIASPFLVEGRERVQQIVRIEDNQWSDHTTSVTSVMTNTLFSKRDFNLTYGTGYIY